ncbi:MAG: Dihydroorotase [Acidimicrobiales bacterium AG-410-I20]|nr:MAG: Dihydroorotase [Acidimicrobiales bacterium AG-410-I20]
MTLVIRGGTVVDSNGEQKTDVKIDQDGSILEIGKNLTGDQELDASGCVVTAGFVDLHSHLREPGQEDAETIETGSRGGALGGYTALVAMPNTTPTMDCLAVIDQVRGLGQESICEVIPTAAMTVDRKGEKMAPMGELVDAGVGIFTDDGRGLQDPRLMRRIMEYSTGLAHRLGRPIILAQHCEIEALSCGGHMHEGTWSSKLGIPGQPAEAEELMVSRDIALVRLTGAHMHFQHLSTAGSVDMVRKAKEEGLPVTSEATTHHFSLTDASCASYDPVFKVHPPLRTDADVKAVKEGLADGTIDAIATDHAPHTDHSKEKPFSEAPPGMLGLETAFSIALEESELDIHQIFSLMSWRPAVIAGISNRHGMTVSPGSRANLCVIDLDETWTVSGKSMASFSSNTPYEGRRLRGHVRHTIQSGEAVVIDGEAQR